MGSSPEKQLSVDDPVLWGIIVCFCVGGSQIQANTSKYLFALFDCCFRNSFSGVLWETCLFNVFLFLLFSWKWVLFLKNVKNKFHNLSNKLVSWQMSQETCPKATKQRVYIHSLLWFDEYGLLATVYPYHEDEMILPLMHLMESFQLGVLFMPSLIKPGCGFSCTDNVNSSQVTATFRS